MSSKMTNARAIFFDLDGTLIDISEREVHAIHDTANYFGLDIPRAQVKQLFDNTMKKPSFSMQGVAHVPEDVFKALGLALTDEVTEHWASAFLERYHLSTLRRDTRSTLEDLSQRYNLFCTTSRETLAEVELELKYHAIKDLFDGIITREVAAKHFGLDALPFTPFEEQRRRLYECTLAIANCHPGEILAVGDMASELKPAKEMGIKTVGLLTDKGKELGLRKVSDILIVSLSELKSILERYGINWRPSGNQSVGHWVPK